MTELPRPSATTAARHFLSGCVQAGLSHVVISPGSRSAPLALAATATDGLSHSIHLDERIAGFAALGQAKVTGHPVGLICTSGTAAANFLPAVAEASEAGVPLVVLTADRPPEHRGWGVGQAFDQLSLYGSRTRLFISMPVGSDGGLHHAVREGHRAVRAALVDRGPVHVNWPFRLPLEEPDDDSRPALIEQYFGEPVRAGHQAVDELRALLVDRGNAVIVAGPDAVRAGPDRRGRRQAIWDFATAWKAPIIADGLSGLRGAPEGTPVVDAAELVVASGSAPEPGVVLRIGDTPTAKPIRLWWESLTSPHVIIDDRTASPDPSHASTHVVVADPAATLAAVGSPPSPPATEAGSWVTLGGRARRAVSECLASGPADTEAHIVAALAESAMSTIVASSSMPVRDVDTFLPVDSSTRVVANRGINGIDGVVATAIGVSRGLGDEPVTVLIGDVAALHDIGAILDAARSRIPLTIVIPHNDGGGIFSFLPVRHAIDAERYTELFHTPHGTDFSFLDGVDGLHFAQVDVAGLGEALTAVGASEGTAVIVVPVETDRNVAAHRAVQDAVTEALKS